jgi:hypothetical protein
MPYTEYDEPYNTGNLFDVIFRLIRKDEKIHFRLIGKPYYDGKHFLKNDDGSWNVVDCDRINLQAPCEYCARYFQIIKESKLTNDKDLIEAGKKQAQQWKATLSFYLPIINREIEEFQVFKTTLSVKKGLEEEVAMGTPVMERDFIVLRTEKPGSEYYKLSRLDTGDTKPLNKKEKAEIERFKSMDLSDIVSGKVDEGSSIDNKEQKKDEQLAKDIEDTLLN